MKFKKEAAYILGGTAAIEAGPSIIEETFRDLGVGSEIVKNTELGKMLEGVIDFGQEIAPPVAVLALSWLGLKTMLKGIEGDKEK